MYFISFNFLSPFTIGKTRSGNFVETLDFIPGTVIKGALAAAFMRSPLQANRGLFESIFLNDKVRFTHAYLGNNTVEPIPLSARTCKTFSGFKSDSEDNHGVGDFLIKYYLYQNGVNANHIHECPECSSPYERITGYYSKTGQDEVIKTAMFEKNIITRTAINEISGTAKEGSLFSTETILPSKEFVFTSRIFDAENAENHDIMEFCMSLDNRHVYIGAEKSYGMGQCRINFSPIPPTQKSILQERYEKLNSILKGSLQDQTRKFFSVSLLADTIILDKYLSFCTSIDENSIKIYFPSDFDFTLEYGVSDMIKLSGWNLLHRLPKEQTYAIAKGSVFLFSCNSSIDDSVILKFLENIEKKGLGERTAEGFGNILICNQFHLEDTLL